MNNIGSLLILYLSIPSTNHSTCTYTGAYEPPKEHVHVSACHQNTSPRSELAMAIRVCVWIKAYAQFSNTESILHKFVFPWHQGIHGSCTLLCRSYMYMFLTYNMHAKLNTKY
jgi:hypothetical protein